ncbi:alpha/beta hydrolase [Fusibacter paucivorans]|uniref:Alpha/beta hydrolase n=1 Tax=Fusibacter paucivorans TaxID=76009 RepID=A0ABS5PP09_9FIRM|nr:alpha/beta hydrolase [Fusibacter paucivorans]MBS7526803.1 alpha/beta hydrolase [Fusibacter paucivorans]
MKEAFTLNAFGDITLFGYQLSQTKHPQKVVILVHGMAETIARYEMFAAFLAEHDIAVFAYDQRGHGKTAGSTEMLGELGEDGWNRMKHELRKIVAMARESYPDTPVFIFGHSMGSFVTRDFLFDFQHLIDGVILSGTGFPSKTLISSGYHIASFIQTFKGVHYHSKIIDHLTFGAYTKKYEQPKTRFDWLSRDEAEVQKFVNDPYCGALHPVGFFTAFSENLKRILYDEYFKTSVLPKPMLLMSGSMDPVGDFGKGVKKSAEFYREAGFNVSLKLYENGRHEMLNEINREMVYNDIINWLNEH